MAKKKALFLTLLLAVAFGLTALVALLAEKKEKTEDRLFLTSFYPVYLLADSVAAGAKGVTVRNLTENHGGCLHDYTLTTKDMRLLSEADLLLINGGEMEPFVEKVAGNYKGLTIVDTSEGFAFLEGVEHSHNHETEPDEHEENGEEHEGHEHHMNGHLWLDADGYLLQLSKIEEAFVAADPAQEELYRANAEQCREKLIELSAEFAEVKKETEGRQTVVFHEGFVYLLRMVGIETVHCLSMDSDTQIAAGEAAEIVEECKLHGIDLLFVQEEYRKKVRETFGAELSGRVVTLNPITGEEKTLSEASGKSEKGHGVDRYCELMRENLKSIKQAYGLR